MEGLRIFFLDLQQELGRVTEWKLTRRKSLCTWGGKQGASPLELIISANGRVQKLPGRQISTPPLLPSKNEG